MKDLMKRLLCVLMALMMVMALVACGESEDDDNDRGSKRGNKETTGETTEETTTEPVSVLVGEWECYLDATEYFNDLMFDYLGMEDMINEFTMRLTFEVNEDGTCELAFDEDYLEGMFDNLVDDIWDAMMEMTAEEADMTVEEVEDMMKEQGVTKDMLADEMDLESAFEELENLEGYWLLDGDELYIAEDEDDVEDADPIEIEFDGDDSFSMNGGDGLIDGMDEDMMEMFLPLVFERV